MANQSRYGVMSKYVTAMGGGGGGSILPLTLDFSTLPDGALPSSLTGATWSISGGMAVNTPTLGVEKLTDPGLETWASATNLTSWTEYLDGTSAVDREATEKRSGTYGARLTGTDAGVFIGQSLAAAVAAGDWVELSGWVKTSAPATLRQTINDQFHHTVYYTTTTDYAQYILHVVIAAAASSLATWGKEAASAPLVYLDDLSVKVITPATLFAALNAGQTDVITKADWTIPNGSMAGVVMNLDSLTAPTSFVALLCDTANVHLIKVAGGTTTRVAIVGLSGAYTAGGTVELRKSGTTYQMYYAGVQIGTDQTITGMTGTLHGMVAMGSLCQCDFFSVALAG